MSQCELLLDGKRLSGEEDIPLIDFFEKNGISLPHVCYLKTLGPLQTCDTCWVEIDGELKRSCAVKSASGLDIKSASPLAREAREEGMDRLLSKHELYCTVCENNNGDCTLHNTVADMGIDIQRYDYQRKPYQKDTSSPFYTYDPDQCILCGRCVEACQNIEVNETLSIDYSMENPRVLWDGGKPIDESSCVHCGHCVTVCPCNALLENSMDENTGPFTFMPKQLKRSMIDLTKQIEKTTGAQLITGISVMDMNWRQPEIKRTKTVCTYCGVGCSFEMWTRDRTILKIQPVEEAPVNGISTCIKGKFAWDFVNSNQRLKTPLIRENGAFREANWDEALSLVARRLLEVRDTHGPDSIGIIGSSKASNEEAYLAQKLARQIIGTNNIDNSSRYCQSPASTGLKRTAGYGADAGRIEDLQHADVVVIVGSNTAESHPVIASRLKAAHKHGHQKHIVVDTRKHEMAERADRFLRPNASTDLAWTLAVTRYQFDHGYADTKFLAERVAGVDEFRRSLEPYTLEFAAEVTGLSVETLTELAETIGKAERLCIVWAMGITQHAHGADTSTAFSNLLLTTGNFGRPGTGGYPMRGHNNVQGASDFGCLRHTYPGYDPVTDDEVRERWAKGWGVDKETLPGEVGEGNFLMVQAAEKRDLKAMFVIGEETAFSDADTNNVHDAFSKLDFLVVQDMFVSRTAQFADVVLPACASVEKEGTFVNTERRIQRFYEVMPPLGESRPDWQILTKLAQRMGYAWDYQHPAEIMAECAAISPLFAGVSYERLEGWNSLLWPVDAEGNDSPYLYRDSFPKENGKAQLHPVEWQPPAEANDEDYPFMLDNGRLLEHFQGLNQSGKTEGILEQVPDWFVEVGPDMAQQMNLEDGSWVRVTSRRGSLEVKVCVTDRVSGYTLFMPIHQGKPGLNLLTGEHHDPDVDTPAYKETAVRLERLPKEKGQLPLPHNNFRYGHRTPIEGVPVEVKWMQEDYRQPPEHQAHPEKN
ncbi:formate dehydrogenase subunit alpha [Chromohalobacter sp. HP20-39]|uniref:formate dehydrogenase subunit alpha n=1 Tax=Chromohalobacter sp. HP20-39 TaxID=3079306 RepID=UPI00294B4581|nr:formate dehydrogenase subunit alpha [Chromohalobacter sp. HP20-39]MDV6319402.1 formate dehydrogenase subunit alpha [Chromohalobacter sp. HP20-39]